MTIDEAVYLGRKAIREQTLIPRPDIPGWTPNIRDWGAPVLYMRSPGGYIFPPITDRAVRRKAEGRSNRLFQLQQASYRWAERGGTASRGELADQEGRESGEWLAPTQALFLLHSAVVADTSAAPWLRALRAEDGERFIRLLDDAEQEQPAGPEETLRVLGLDAGIPAEWPRAGGPVARSAAHHADGFIRRTAALALLALAPSPAEGLERLRRTLGTVRPGALRWWRRAELYGAMADADPAVESENQRLSPLDRLGIWLWRVRRRVLRNHRRILALAAGGALGAGLALGLWSMGIALLGGGPWRTVFFVYSYLGAILGLSAALGIALARPTLLLGQAEEPPPRTLAWRGFLLGSVLFAIGNFVVAWFNLLDLSIKPWTPIAGALAGIGICAALFGQPQGQRRPGLTGWLLRLAAAGLVGALAQGLIFAVGGDYEAASFSSGAWYFETYYGRYPVIKSWMDSTPGWEQIVLLADTALAASVLAIGTLAGLRASTRWLAWWRRTVGGQPAGPAEEERP